MDPITLQPAGLPPLPYSVGPYQASGTFARINNCRHIRIQPFCILCRKGLPVQQYIGGEPPPERWACDTLAIFRAEPPDGNPEDSRLGVVRIDFSVYGWVRDEVFSQAQQQFNARFCLAQTRCPKCRPDDTADFVHTACLQQAKASIPGFSTRTLRDIAQYARPLLPWHFAESLAGLDRNPNTLPLSSSISTSTELGQLLEQIERRLPFELQDLILDDVEGFFRILSASCTTLSWYRQSIKKQGLATQPLQTTFPLRHCPEIKKIGANFTPILGEICLKDIGEGSSTPFEQAIDVAYGVRGFQYSIGAYGVVAFRVLYNDGAPSPWLGGGKDRWTTTYEAADLTKLYAVSDGCKLLRLDLEGSTSETSLSTETSSTRAKSARLFWDHDSPFPPGTKHPFVDVDYPGANIYANPRARLAKHVEIPNFELQSLTMQVCYTGLSGISANENGILPSAMTESSSALITRFLRPGETIQSLNLVIREQGQPTGTCGPYVMIQTSRGRDLFFGPHMTYFLLKVSIYTFEVKDTEAISGMFYDPTSIRKSALYTLGVTLEPRPKRAFSRPQSLIISVPRPNRISPKSCLKRFMLHTFLSKTHLLDVKTLSTMIAEGRYIGLRIERTTGVVDIFGQWDRHDGRVLPLYDINEGTLRRLTFVYSKPAPRVRIVSDILVCTDAKSPQTTATLSHTWSDLSVVHVWWSSAVCDQVEPWRGEKKEIDMADEAFTHHWVR